MTTPTLQTGELLTLVYNKDALGQEATEELNHLIYKLFIKHGCILRCGGRRGSDYTQLIERK